MARTRDWSLALILVAAALLRLLGIGWGVPDATHLASYHPDEWSQVNTALSMVASGDLNPHFFNYPSLGIYLTAAWFWLLSWVVPLAPEAMGLWYVLARLLTVVAGVGGVWLTWRLGRVLLGARAALLAAALVAVWPLAVVNSHFATVDVPLLAWTTLATLAATHLALAPADGDERRAARWLWVGAAAAGLAAGTKYNGVLVGAPLLLGAWLGGWLRRAPGRVAAAVALAAALFVLSSPYVIIDPAAGAQIRFELIEHPKATNLFDGVGPGWWFQLSQNLPTAIGWVGLVLAGLGWLTLARRREAWPALVWLLLGLLSMTRTRELFIRYWLPVLPVLAIGAAAGAQWLHARLAAQAAGRRRQLAVAVAAVALLGPTLRSVALAGVMNREDARSRALAWCVANIPAGARVGEIERTWFWSVPLRPNNTGRPRDEASDRSRWDLRDDPAAWTAQPPEWLVINENKRRERYHADAAGWAALVRDYEPVQRFANEGRVGPGWTEHGRGSRQHDWLYILPEITIYRRR